jgi:hypothetical protein
VPRFIYVVIVCAFIVAALGVDSGIAADKNSKVTLVYEHALPNVPGKSIKSVLVEIWSRRYVVGPHASQVCFHLRNRSRRSDPKFRQ